MYYRDYSVNKYAKGGMMAKGGTTKAKGGKFGINDMVMVDDSGYIKLFTGFDTTKPAKIIDVNKVKTSRGTLYTYGLEFDGGKKPFNYAMENKLSLVNSGMMANGGKMAKGYNIATNFNSAKNRIQDVEKQADIDFNISMVEANSMAKCFEAYGKNCSGEVILSIGFDYFAYIELGNGITILSNIGITKFVYAFGHEDMTRFDTYERALEWLEYPIRYANKGGKMAKGGEMKMMGNKPKNMAKDC